MKPKEKRQCKCKLLPWTLSANTAAEYGDLGSLTHRLSKSRQASYSKVGGTIIATSDNNNGSGSGSGSGS
eukprot:CAMPEP_0194121880 /NCGR_PEP_ID=MMETSP0150-20130528/48744_1 /TAXON_ID=122233 /ORGANISM="Chaetoceros debilis, Strain MM31A-1" /LENGTH=69 /DNA_ID=CAMNT_0038814515 /DNA_START=26 /DNA_END=232 /DNA_ORIENTATION=+